MSQMVHRRALLLASAVSFAAFSSPAAAQDADSASAEAQAQAALPEEASGEIVVTARRRVESLQDVPIAVTAYSGEQLESQGALDITDISDTTPNVTLETSRGTNTTLTAFIRGVGQQDPVAGFEAGVGLYLDDVYLNRPQAAVLDIYDVERIEVLRGPQGTLYGRNTIGGAIKYVTRRLPNRTTVSLRGNLGTYNQADFIASASTPLGNSVRVGAAFARLGREGFGDNLITGASNYNKDILAARGTIEFDPSSAFSIRVSGDYTDDQSAARNGHRLIVGQLSGAPVLDDVYDTRAGLISPKQQVRAYGGAIHANLELSDTLTLRNITAYRRDKSFAPIDFDSLPAADVDVPAIYRNRQFSNELQLLYEGDRIQGVAGIYYLNANANNAFDVILATTLPTVLPGLTAGTFGDVDTRTWAAFADFTYEFTDQLSVALGGRYTVDKRSATVIRANFLNGPSPALGGNGVQLGALTSDFEGKETFKEFTPRASISFQPNDRNTFYLSYSKGFKGGGFDPRGLSTAAPDLDGNGTRSADEIFDYFLFEPEKVTSYEAGYKASMFDRRLRFALAGFIADYRDVQVPGSVGAVINGVPTFVGVTTNAGKASFKGVEAEVTAALWRSADLASRLNFSGTLGYLDAKYDEFITNIAGQGPVDVADFRRIQNTPKWTASGTLDYSAPLSDGELTASTTVSYRTKTFQFETPSPFLDQSAYALFDANLMWRSDGGVSIGLHGKNLTDKQYKTSGYQFLAVNPVTGVPLTNAAGSVIPSLGREGVVTAFYGNPRQVFLSFGYKF
ncbi:MAG: TonB-dependent receptor [Pseudomonadota bacterium]|nr:TonB-dependent receptor [Pseudomonadota bacterium]